MSILNISKTDMYDFHCDYMKAKCGENCRLPMTDTDSLMYEVKTEDFYKDISEDVREKFDTSNFLQNHSSGILRMNKNVPGMFKDECGGEIISEFVGLRAKLHAYKKHEKMETRSNAAKVTRNPLFQNQSILRITNDGYLPDKKNIER